MSVRAFGEEMEERFPDLRGATYGGARVYAKGNVQTPRIALLRAMAEVLEVRADWLAYDEGEMTEEQQRAQQAREESAPSPEQPTDPSFAAINRALKRTDLFDGPTSSGLQGVAHEAIGEILTSRGQAYPDEPLSDSEAALLVWSLRKWINGPWKLLRQDTEARWADYRAYCITILHALLIALPDAGVVNPRTLAARVVPLGRGAGGYWRTFQPEDLPEYVPDNERDDVARWLNEALKPREEDEHAPQ